MWIEFSIGAYEVDQEFVFNFRGLDDPVRIKESADLLLKKVLASKEFEEVEIVLGNKGTHSMRKFSVSFPRLNGFGKDETDLRAIWKGKGRKQDTYVDSTLPYPDAKVCAALCKGGPGHYRIK